MSLVRSEMKGDVLVITFEDPSSRNAWSLRASRELSQILETHKDRFRALVFTANGRVFCSGGQLAEYAALKSADEGRAINAEISQHLDHLSRLGVPTVVVIDGDCFGGGMELASCFDFMLASPYALFGLWQSRIGLTYGWGGGARLERKLGSERLKQWSLTAQPRLARELREAGWVTEITAGHELLARAEALAQRLAQASKPALAALKAYTASQEREIFDALWWGPDHLKALASFRKRS